MQFLLSLEKLLAQLEEHGWNGLEEAYTAKSCTLGREVQVIGHSDTWMGRAEALDDTGALMVRAEDGSLRRVLSGDVSVRGLMGYV